MYPCVFAALVGHLEQLFAFGGGGRGCIGFSYLCVGGFFGEGAFTALGRPSGGGWYRGTGGSGGVCEVL